MDFAKLIPRDRVMAEEDNQVQLVMKAGSTFFVPAIEGNTHISNMTKWAQAFRVYSDIYCHAHPDRSTELIQYSHVIHTTATTYTWDNVNMYNKDFRLHLGENPGRSWAIILQQVWSMRLKDKFKVGDNFYKNRAGDGSKGNPRNFCKRFNRGCCTFGARCTYEHRCSYCFKAGHGFHNCRKRAADYKEREQCDVMQSHQNGAHPSGQGFPMITDGKKT